MAEDAASGEGGLKRVNVEVGYKSGSGRGQRRGSGGVECEYEQLEGSGWISEPGFVGNPKAEEVVDGDGRRKY
jgi:hypothetical protein